MTPRLVLTFLDSNFQGSPFLSQKKMSSHQNQLSEDVFLWNK